MFLGALVTRAEPVTFDKDVKPIFSRCCTECHGGGKPKAGLGLTSYDGVLKGSKKRKVLVAGKPDESRLVLVMEDKIKHPVIGKKGGKPPRAGETAQVRAWIKDGAKQAADSQETSHTPRQHLAPSAFSAEVIAFTEIMPAQPKRGRFE